LSITYRYRSATYVIEVHNPSGVSRGVAAVTVDGAPQADRSIPLADDGQVHQVAVAMGAGVPHAVEQSR